MISNDVIKPRVIPPQNIVNRLMIREIYGAKKPGTHIHVARSFHQNVFPNFTIINVEKPPCFLRKFSPNGHYFIAFSSDQTSIEIYEYRGSSAVADLVENCVGDYIGHKRDMENDNIRTQVFSRFFKLKWTVNVADSLEQLNRECSLFTDDGRYVIVGSAAYIPEDLRPHFYEIYTNNEAVTPNPRSPLEDYTLHIVDLQNGKLCDIRQFKVDKIFLSHNQGLYLYKDTLAVLSVQHQTIHMFQIIDGMFIDVRTIGRFCFEDDSFVLSSVTTNSNNTYRPYRETMINSLKHRLLVFLYKRSVKLSEISGHPFEVRRFCRHFEQVSFICYYGGFVCTNSLMLLGSCLKTYMCKSYITVGPITILQTP